LCDHQQVSNDHDACSSTRKISAITQQATEVFRLQLGSQCNLQKSCGRAKELVDHRIPARKGAECELDVACSQRAEDGSRCREVLGECPNTHAPRGGQDPGVVPRSVDRSASARRCESTTSKSDAKRPIRPSCKQHGVGYERSCAKGNSTSEDPCSQNHTHGYGSANRTPYKRRRASVAYRLAPTCWPRRATNRSIHLEPLTRRGHISKPALPQIYPRCLYAYPICKTDGPKKPTRPLYASAATTYPRKLLRMSNKKSTRQTSLSQNEGSRADL
jgi:hypothetical protein